MSKLYFRYGAMNSGKSTALLQIAHNYEERGQKVIIVKPSIDTKGSDRIISRIGADRKVDLLLPMESSFIEKFNNFKNIDCILVDEAQFLTPKQVNEAFMIAVVQKVPVICYGIRGDFKTKSFPGSRRLLEIAHSIEELKTICRCGKKAIFNGRIVNGHFVRSGTQVAIDGDKVEYESLCGECYVEKVGSLIS